MIPASIFFNQSNAFIAYQDLDKNKARFAG